MLYTQEFIASLPKANHFENPWVIALVTYDKNTKLRKLIEEWYSKLPKEIQKSFYSKLRSTDDLVMVPAFYELMAYQYCKEEGWDVEYEAEVLPGKTPDLIVTKKDGYKFVLEVATLFDSKELLASLKRMREITQKIVEIETDWILELQYSEYPPQSVKPRVAVAAVKNWLNSLPSDAEKQGCSFGRAIAGFTFSVDISKDLPQPSAGCVFSIGYPGGKLPDYSEKMRDVLNQKAKKYSSKKTGLPLVILIGDGISFLSGGPDLVDKALFGVQQITFGDGNNVKASRDGSGYFAPTVLENGELKGKNTGISAVLYASLKEQGSFSMQVFHNPVSHLPLKEDVFYKIPQFILVKVSNQYAMRWVTNDPESSRIRFDLDDYDF